MRSYKELKQVRQVQSIDLNKDDKSFKDRFLQRLPEIPMLDIDLLHEHDSLRAVPIFHILDAFLLRIDYKRYLFRLFYDFEIVKDILILVNTQLSEDNSLLIFHEPVDIILVEG